MILAIDPGPEKSAWLLLDGGRIVDKAIDDNRDLLPLLPTMYSNIATPHLVLEMVASFGMPVGREVFETVFWIGRFAQAWPGFHIRIYRQDIKLHLCRSVRAKDSNIRQALIDRFGPPGTKKKPGKTYGITKDLWSALAIAVTFRDTGGRYAK